MVINDEGFEREERESGALELLILFVHQSER